jgi:hypothetical protein
MRLVLHIGLHKTASTAFQTLCRDNAARLLEHGVYWRVHEGYPAHHEAAWKMLRGEDGAVSEYLEEARARGALCALISSEELDYVLQVPQKAVVIERDAREAGATEVIWVAALRRPSESFRSNISELTKHGIHVDPLQGYLEVMRTGGLHFINRLNGGVQFWNWFFTLDYRHYFDRLRATVRGRVLAYDYHAEERLPGAAILRAACAEAEALIAAIDPPGQVNVRLTGEETSGNLACMLRGHGHDEQEVAALLALQGDARTSATELGTDAIMDAMLDARFGDYAQVLGDGVRQVEEV